MGYLSQIKLSLVNYLLTQLGAVNGLDLPDNGRSSQEKNFSNLLSKFSQHYENVSPVFDLNLLKTIRLLWLFNPDFSQYEQNIVNLGNPGHKLIVNTASDALTETITTRLNESATRLYQNGGVDGLMNQYLSQTAVFGAVSSEDVVNIPARRVEKVVIVPVEDIRFMYDEAENRYKPYQRAYRFGDNTNPYGRIPLNENTYQYYALKLVENSPYAKPPALAAVEAILTMQKDAVDNVKYVAKKLGLLGIVLAKVRRLSKLGSESEGEFKDRSGKYLGMLRDRLQDSMSRGLVAHFDDQTIDFKSPTNDSRGFYDLFRVIEEQVMSGFAMQPAFFGRTDSTTETYADVVYNLLLAQVGNMQRLAKRRQEQTYRLDLRLAGIDFDSLIIQFNKAHARKPLEEAQAKQAEQSIILEKARSGIISPDQAANELGYDSAFDPQLLTDKPSAASLLRQMWVEQGANKTITLSFNQDLQRYEFKPETIVVDEPKQLAAKNVVDFEKKKATKA
ncbi:MAG: hypothetical protein K1X72_04325 [Pyrinomonadaceae bacterium]|nr:hypothetical protein [Pyrinomonadaceae bacterium]